MNNKRKRVKNCTPQAEGSVSARKDVNGQLAGGNSAFVKNEHCELSSFGKGQRSQVNEFARLVRVVANDNINKYGRGKPKRTEIRSDEFARR